MKGILIQIFYLPNNYQDKKYSIYWLLFQRGKIAQEELKLINPLVKIDWLEELPSEDNNNWNSHNGLVTSTTNFDEMIKFDNFSRKVNIPYYNLVCCGYYGFMYIGLGSKFTYEREKKVVL